MKKRLVALLLTVALLCTAMVLQVASAISDEYDAAPDVVSTMNLSDYYIKTEKFFHGDQLIETKTHDYSFNEDKSIGAVEKRFSGDSTEAYVTYNYTIQKEYDEKHRLVTFKSTPDDESESFNNSYITLNYGEDGSYRIIDGNNNYYFVTFDPTINAFSLGGWSFEYDDQGRKTRMYSLSRDEELLITYEEQNGKTVKKNIVFKENGTIIDSGTVDYIYNDNGSIHQEIMEDGSYYYTYFNNKNQLVKAEIGLKSGDGSDNYMYELTVDFIFDANGNVVSRIETEDSDSGVRAYRWDYTYEYHPAFESEEPEVPDEPEVPYTGRKLPFWVNGIVLGPDGKWAMYKKGAVDTSYTGIAHNKFGWWRVKDGYVDFDANGIYKNEYGWWKTTNGKVTFKETGVFKNEYGWWRVVNSKVDFKANGIYKNKFGWWKTTNGKVTFDETGVFKNEFGWWYVKDSKVDFSFTGIASNKYGTWYIKNGKVDFLKTGKVTFDGKTYQVTLGKAKLA